MPGLVPGIHVFLSCPSPSKTWMAGTSPAMTEYVAPMPRPRRSTLANPHPGEILMEEFLKPMSLSQTALANAIDVPPRRINEIVLGKRAITADTDLRLARYFGMSEGFFIGLQTDYELMQRRREIGDKLKAIRPRAA
jgi:addiction module HigA family antidote